jgi:translation initiation factor IF-1
VNYIIRNGKTINAKIATGCKEFKIFSGDIVKKKNSVEIDLEKYKLIKGKDYVFEKGDVVIRYEKSVNDKGQIINKRKEIK